MLKYILFVAINIVTINAANCENRDTIISYFKNDLRGNHKVSTLDSADFFRMILPPDPSETLYNVKEYYKNGEIKFFGKSNPMINGVFAPETISLTGDCVSYYPDGKKQSITHYTDGSKDGNEYIFYPTGLIYCYQKNMVSYNAFTVKSIAWECYDAAGNMICKDGNGEWIIYDIAFKKIVFRGAMKNGCREGEWRGQSPDADSIKYIYQYKKGAFVSAAGYDKAGVAYPFVNQAEFANYKGGPITFIKVFKGHLTLPKGPDGGKMSADTVHISFTIERDGHVIGFKTLGDVNPVLNNALAEAFSKCHDWTPARLYGIPLRTQITLPLDFAHGFRSDSRGYHEQVFFKSRILGF